MFVFLYLCKSRVALQPRGVEAERQRSAVGGVVSLQVVPEQVVELLVGVDVGAGGYERASGQGLVEPGILPERRENSEHWQKQQQQQ